MSDGERQTVNSHGQITIPKGLREKFGIRGGDDVRIREADGEIIIEPIPVRDELAEGNRRRANRHRKLATEFTWASSEANDLLGDAPNWEAE